MGILRLYLAICVISAHSERCVPWAAHGGRDAVQIFYILSGFYMAMVLSNGKYQTACHFYASRAARIFPTYFTILLLVLFVSTLSGLWTGDWLSLTTTLSSRANGNTGKVFAIASNFTVFFQDWVMFLQHDVGHDFKPTSNFWSSNSPLFHYLWVPQAWTIGVELSFYLLSPILVQKLKMPGLLTVIFVAHVFRLLAYNRFGLGDPWNYRCFALEIPHFCDGIIAYRSWGRMRCYLDASASAFQAAFNRWQGCSLLILWSVLIFVFWMQAFILHTLVSYATFFSKGAGELMYLLSLATWIVVLPLVFSFTRDSKIDRAIGELSYPVYLIHFLVVQIVTEVFSRLNGLENLRGEVSTVVAIIISIGLHVVVLGRFEAMRASRVRQLANS